MQSNAYHDCYANGSADLYKEVFQVLDQLGMADLKITFQEHCIQDQTLSFVENEVELKQILKEIGIPLGRCIPIMKSWSKRYSRKETRQLSRVAMLDQSSQASVETADAGVQTENEFDHMIAANYPPALNNMTEIQLSSEQRDFLNQYAAMAAGAGFEADKGHRELGGPLPVSYGAQPMDPYVASQMFIPQYHNDFAHNIYGSTRGYIQVPTNAGVPAEVIPTNSAVDIHGPEAIRQNLRQLNHADRPLASPPLQTHEAAGHHGLSRSIPGPKDIVDEREDLAIEQSLKHFEDLERESQHSYASALNSDGPTQSSHAGYTAVADQPSQKAHQPHPVQPYSSHHEQRLQPSLSAASSNPRTQTVPKMASVRDKTDYSQFAKCDDIAVDNGALRKSSSLQNVASQTLQAYLESIPESKEYKEAMQSRNPKNGWKHVDGKHMASGRKVPFKPIFWDSEGRMRHGVRVRGADKSEECWRHTEGKAPAGCTFAHSRLGDTLEFICVKCTCEKTINDWCIDKMKHKQYIFNLGAFRNLEGGVWKKSS